MIVLYAIAPNAPLLTFIAGERLASAAGLVAENPKAQAAVPRGFTALVPVILNDISYADNTRMPR
ncbi:MAG TPA: hypothetical protein VGY99_16580 [Candidatus Binataceae bacterium]|nr:hypothetical protein [Candidatus Binataceae bacterium]